MMACFLTSVCGGTAKGHHSLQARWVRTPPAPGLHLATGKVLPSVLLITDMAELQGRLGKEEGWAGELEEMEKLKEGEFFFLFLQCAPLLTIISSFLNGNQSGNRDGTNKSELGNSWGENPASLLCPYRAELCQGPWVIDTDPLSLSPSFSTVLSWIKFL